MSLVQAGDYGYDLARMGQQRAIDVLRDQIAPKASDSELAYFHAVCVRLDLTPFTGEQIYLVGRYDGGAERVVHKPHIGVAGRRVLAVRTGELVGIDGPMWTAPRGDDGEHHWMTPWEGDGYPYCARTLVYRRGWIIPANGTTPWAEFAQKDRGGKLVPKWRDSPAHMIGKCSESLALRRAFPEAIPQDLVPVVGDYDLDDVDPETPAELEEGTGELAADDTRRTLGWRIARLRDRGADGLAAFVRDEWDRHFDGTTPKVIAGPYTVDDARWLEQLLDHAEAELDSHDDDPEAYEPSTTRYDPDDGQPWPAA